jgi:hypothetical protein
MADAEAHRQSATRWNQTALIWLAAFWAPVVGAYAHLEGQAPDRLAADAALVYVAALAVGLAALTAACVGAHALLIAAVRWLALRPDPWRRPLASVLCVGVGGLLAYEWTTWATRLAHTFAAPQPLPDALAHAVGVGIALAYLAVGLGVAGAPWLLAVLPARPVPASAGSRQPAPAVSAPRLIAPGPYPVRRAAPAAALAATTSAALAAPTVAAMTGSVPVAQVPASPPAAATPASRPAARPQPSLDTPLLLRYPARPTAPPALAQPEEPAAPMLAAIEAPAVSPPVADETPASPVSATEPAPPTSYTPSLVPAPEVPEPAVPAPEVPAPEVPAFAASAPRVVPLVAPRSEPRPEPRTVPVVVPRMEPRTVPVVPRAASASDASDRVRISTEVHLEPMAEDMPPA